MVGCETVRFTLAISDRGGSGVRLCEHREAVSVLGLSRFDQTLNVTGKLTQTAIRSVVVLNQQDQSLNLVHLLHRIAGFAKRIPARLQLAGRVKKGSVALPN